MYMKAATGALPAYAGQQPLERLNSILFIYSLIISYIYGMYFDNGKSLFLRNNLYYVNSTLFLMCVCVYTHTWVCRCMHVQVSVYMCMQRPEFNFGCHSEFRHVHLVLLRQGPSLTWKSPRRLVGWPVSLRDHLASASVVLG